MFCFYCAEVSFYCTEVNVFIAPKYCFYLFISLTSFDLCVSIDVAISLRLYDVELSLYLYGAEYRPKEQKWTNMSLWRWLNKMTTFRPEIMTNFGDLTNWTVLQFSLGSVSRLVSRLALVSLGSSLGSHSLSARGLVGDELTTDDD
jgi:hypothetical protein